ncbi:MAG: 50S ribosomal protein L34e [Candidatus Heimdallarchaeota archaeon]|jgi:large subunit ribosomal protein L34e|nr:50S ribosomal protein L34e [Candidatus Heimdallarchaeota archaeon]MCK5144143.1 50S ribosomal protein L34e [Candidatus Heimdallarchaeota archaeon]TET74691.1 MAG: 50S ribosomal protein L34e [Candidatus Heimdallarchaeota archaeon]
MVKPSLRVAKTRKRRTPSGTKLRRVDKRTKKPHCANCGAIVHGVAFGNQNRVRKMSRSERLPTRQHAGHLCSNCLKSAIKAEVRS